MKEKGSERERKKDPYGMSCHESPLKQTVAGEEEGRRRDRCLCRGHKHLDRGSSARGGGVRGRDMDGVGGLRQNCLGENENDGWCGICR